MQLTSTLRQLLFIIVSLSTLTLANAQSATSTTLTFVEEKKDQAREQLKRIFKAYDLDDWIFTTTLQVDHGVDAHSMPILTMNTNHLDSDKVQLSIFVHENAHWFVDDGKKDNEEQHVIAQLKELYPNPPEKKQKNLYHHIMVAWVEFDGLIELIGEEETRTVIDEKLHYYTKDNPDSPLSKNYIWYYNTAINNAQQVGKLMVESGFNINPDKGIVVK